MRRSISEALDLGGGHAAGVEVLACDNRRFLHEAIGHRARQRVVEDHVLEGDGAPAGLDIGCGRQLEPQDRTQLVDRPNPGARAVAVRLVHQEHQIRQPGQIVEVAGADVLRQSLDARRLTAAHLRVDLGDVEDVDPHRPEQAGPGDVLLLVVVAGDDHGRVGRKLGNTPEDILRRVRREVRDQLVVDGQVGRQHEEVVDAVGLMQIADEGTHEPGLAHAGRERETQRGEVPLEIRDRRELAADDVQHGGDVGRLSGRHDVHDPAQDLQRPALGRAQAQAAGDSIDMAIHLRASLFDVVIGRRR